MRRSTSSSWSEYLIEGRLVFDGPTPSPNFYSCINGCMRAIISSTGALDCFII